MTKITFSVRKSEAEITKILKEHGEGKAAAAGFTWRVFKDLLTFGILFVMFIDKIFFVTVAYSDKLITFCKKYFKEHNY